VTTGGAKENSMMQLKVKKQVNRCENPVRATRAATTEKKAAVAKTSSKDQVKEVAKPAKAVEKAAASSKPAKAEAVDSAAGRDLVYGMVRPTISEKDLLKSKEDDYMSKDQLNFFKFKLLEVRSQILANASDTGEHLRENEVTTDPADRATQEEEYTLELRTRDRERKLLKKVERSLRMIDEGSYGWCEESGEPIGLPRLLARPTATLSLEAQERRERMQKLYG
jgi:DnaK suppressor protein